ncbi:MAG TPA: sigma-54 dependent transcriptional regulator [Terriglobales bacterium]
MTRTTGEYPPSRFSVVIVTNDQSVPPEAEAYLSAEYDLRILSTWNALIKRVKLDPPHGVILDIDIVGEGPDEGISALSELRSLVPDLLIAALTRSHRKDLRYKAVDAMVDEYFVAPINFEEVRIVLGRALEKRCAEMEYRDRLSAQAERHSLAELIGASEPMARVYETIQRIADRNTTVLVRGESGTGKELVARAIVSLSPRAAKPFISINCAALPEHLIETELFGHEKGAFTDAKAARPGHVELAHTGTLFLDEIATLSLALQSKLLRVLENRSVTRIGGHTAKKIDFRLITATNEDLETMVQAGRFREDLYYRINVVPISLPPLRERSGDVPLLVDHFLRIYCAEHGMALKTLDPEVMRILEDDPWPGNVRELQNLVQRLVLMVDGPVIEMRHLPKRMLYTSTTSQDSLLIPEGGVNFAEEISRIEVAYLEAALRRTDGNKMRAARLLKIDKQKIHYLCRKYQIAKVTKV